MFILTNQHGAEMLINPAQVVIAYEGDEGELTAITMANGTLLTVRESLEEILRIMDES